MFTAYFPALEGKRAAYRSKSAWGPWSAVGMSVAIFVMAALLALLAGELSASLFGTPSIAEMAGGGTIADRSMKPELVRYDLTLSAVTQALLVALTILAAGFLHRNASDVLGLVTPQQGWGVLVPAFLILYGVVAVYSGLAYLLWPSQVVADLKPFSHMLRSGNTFLLMATVVVGAPLSEELLFRGFLLSGLARSRLGFVGAALISNILWTSLHAQYSPVGLGEVFLIGLVQSWLLWRTGSLWVPIICHAIYNGLVLAVLFAVPLG